MPASWQHRNNPIGNPAGGVATGRHEARGSEMSEHSSELGRGPSHRLMEFAVAGICILTGLIAIAGGLKAGIGWGPEGPKSGLFPFCVGAAIVLASLVNCIQLWLEKDDGKL